MSEKTFEDLKPLFRPSGIHSGIVKIDGEKCTQCGLCVENCPFQCLEKGSDDTPKMKEGNVGCFSCSNCMVVCPADAVEMVDTWHVDGGIFDHGWPELKMPLEPRDAEGSLSEYTVVEKTILERRSVRNFTDEPVSDHLIRRILEAGRFAPSAGNNQNWKFTVVTDPELLAELEVSAHYVWSSMHAQYNDDEQVVGLWQALGGEAMPNWTVEPRAMIRGLNQLNSKELPSFLNAPCVIFVGGNENMIGPEQQTGIAAQNMNIVTNSLGLGMCWSGFGSLATELNPDLKKRLGFDGGWKIVTSLCIGHPKFKQKGMVKRQARPVTWFRQGGNGPVME